MIWNKINSIDDQPPDGEYLVYDKRYGVVPATLWSYNAKLGRRCQWTVLEVTEDPTGLCDVTHWGNFPDPPEDAVADE